MICLNSGVEEGGGWPSSDDVDEAVVRFDSSDSLVSGLD